MTGDPYEAFDDPYCYENTDVLKNRAGLRDQALLDDFELEMMNLRALEPLPEGVYDPAHYCAAHHHHFQDVYDWAGQYRTVRTFKGGNPFCFPEYIENEMARLFGRLGDASFLPGSARNDFIDAVTSFLADLNVIHCFREGNGRTQLTFVHMLALRAGHSLVLERIERATFIPAMIESFDGELANLRREIANLVKA
ncbi:MAG TPA: Fic family protein [Hyphomonadaceae bacterium]|jgi:cell filamentation protein|nr:Fic family protein [Hyphomonadaceae bacterium]